jgi:cobalt-zinc-cadmium efflux system outer membrane protein
MRIPIAAATFVLLAATHASAEPTSRGAKLTRGDMLARVKQENLSLLAAKHRVSEARAEVISAGVWTNPNVSLSSILLTHGAVTGGKTELVASVDQVLPIGGQPGLKRDVAKGFLTAEERSFEGTAWQLASDAKVAYLGLQRAEARARAIRTGLDDLGRVETIVKERTAAGAGSTYDLVRVSAERTKLEARRADADVEVTSAQAALALSVGKSVDARTVATSDPIAEPPDAPTDVDSLVRRAISQRPEVGSARARADASERRITALRRQYFPSPDLSVGYGRYFNVAGTPGHPDGGALVLGLSLPIPLLDHGQGTVDRGIAAAEEERANRDATELSIQRQVEQAAGAMAVRVEAWRHFRDMGAKDLPRLRQIAELSYKEGKATILELLDAYATSLDGAERTIELQAAAARSVLDLERALGPER